jgi:hypothetical protein
MNDMTTPLQSLIEDAWEKRTELSASAAPANVKDAVAQVLAGPG